MKILYISKPENKGGLLLLLLVIGIVTVLGCITVSENFVLKSLSSIKDISFFVIMFLGILSCAVFLLDEAIWQMRGKEVCKYDRFGVTIVKYKLITIEKKVKWESVYSISEYKPCLIKRLVTFITIAGVPQNSIIILTKEGKKIKCGANLNPRQARKVMNLMIEMTNNAHGCLQN